jgi:UDPglucose--hexose-1-phosphate uridylyltransferase
MAVAFKKITGKSRLMNPLKGHALDEIPYEIRFDPLTGQTGRVFDLPYKPEPHEPLETVERSKAFFCPFCPETLEKSTPLFPKDVIPEGRIRVGTASLIPNLVPFDKYAGVAIFSSRHYIPMEELTAETMVDAFIAALVFIGRIAEIDPLVRFFTINWNYMPPAGSSIVHPHLQPNCGDVPTNELRLQVEACKDYSRQNGRSYWADFVKTEKENGVRYVGELGSTFWTMSFVPVGFLPDVSCVFTEECSLARLHDETLRSFLEGLARVLRYFRQENVFSFNVSIFSVREDEHFRINARICPRLFPRGIGNNDMAYLQAIHKEPFTVRPPEVVCPKVRDVFLEREFSINK